MNDLLLFWSNVLLVLLEVIVLVFFASVFFKKNLSRRKFGASVILLAISNITALALLDSHFWSKAFAVIIGFEDTKTKETYKVTSVVGLRNSFVLKKHEWD